MRRRTEAILLRLAPGEAAMLRELAEESGLSLSDTLRQAIRREHGLMRRLGGTFELQLLAGHIGAPGLSSKDGGSND